MIRRLMMIAACLCASSTVLPAQGLFRDTSVLQVTIVTNLRGLIRERDSTKFTPHAATVTYADAGGRTTKFPATLRARGHFRRQARNCGFPPVKLEFKRQDVRETLFQGNANLKITTNCRPGIAEFEQYVLGEYALYQAYQVVSPRYFRTRLARVTYHDSTGGTNDVTSWAFFVEDDKEVAKKFDASIVDDQGAMFHDLEQRQLDITSLFEYMVANTDWSISGLHNVSLLRDSTGTMFPVAFDFDWSGAVNARYAFPDARLGIRTVTNRLYRGPCRTVAEWEPTIARFVAARPRIEALYAAVPGLDPQRRRTALSYLDEFYRALGTPRGIKAALIDTCLPRGN